jgi:hypothetical protein
MTQRYWQYDPQSGGQKIPPAVQEQIRDRIMAHAQKIRPEHASQIRIRFKAQFAYIEVRHHRTSRWLAEWGRLKGDAAAGVTLIW